LRRFLSLLLPVIILFISSAAALAEDLEMINRPVNTSGLTGLLFTTAPFTLSPRSVEIGVAALSENSTVPNYSVGELPAVSITAGIAQGMELALKGSFFHKTVKEGNKVRGTGDTELSYKWNFLPRTESSSFPALALIITGIAPTGSRDLNLVGGVAHWGTRFGLSAGREITWGDHVIGVYADGQMAVHDLSDQRFRDRYGILNAGLLLPISKYRNLQMLIEYNLVTGIDKISDEGGDYSAVTYGLRLVSEKFNLTIGTQFMHKKVPGFENSNRIVGMTSIKF
jgi:hypothetical protein